MGFRFLLVVTTAGMASKCALAAILCGLRVINPIRILQHVAAVAHRARAREREALFAVIGFSSIGTIGAVIECQVARSFSSFSFPLVYCIIEINTYFPAVLYDSNRRFIACTSSNFNGRIKANACRGGNPIQTYGNIFTPFRRTTTEYRNNQKPHNNRLW